MEDHPDRHELIELLRDKSYRRKRVILASGRESDFYVDGRQTTLHARGATLIATLILEQLRADPQPVGAVGGMTMGADPIATAVSVLSTQNGAQTGDAIHAFIVRKQVKGHGMGNQIEGMANVPEGTRVCVVEDTTTTGGSTLRAIESIEAAGLVVAHVITVVDRQEGAAENLAKAGYTLTPLVTREELESG
jgi:orotate phosphoribosyltransferase